MHTEHFNYLDGDTTCQGYLAHTAPAQPQPAVLVVHDWSGRNAHAERTAERLAELGYVGFAVDMYGRGQTGATTDEKMALMGPLMEDRAALLARIAAAVTAVSALPQVDPSRIAVIGYCFGGLCALDLMRSGADIAAFVSVHGLLTPPAQRKCSKVRGKALVLHGYDDPMVKPQAMLAFADEMNELRVDWQLHMYGGVQHAFTNPLANDAAMGTVYNQLAASRAWQATTDFLAASLLLKK